MAAGKLVAISVLLLIVLGGLLSVLFRVSIFQDWEKNRCNPYVVPFSAFFKPSTDDRTPSQFARDNWSFCQKEYIQNAIRLAATEVTALVDEQSGVADIVRGVISSITDTFVAVWKMCYEAYSAIMKKLLAAASLFRNMLIQLHSLVDRIEGILYSITMALISSLAAFINTVQLVLIVVIIVIGILLVLQIILFFLLMPISGLIITMAALVSVVVVSVMTAVMASTVAGGCFAGDTLVHMANGIDIPISEIRIGDILVDGGKVSAVHTFLQQSRLYNLDGVYVTGDHLVVQSDGTLIPVCQDKRALPSNRKDKRIWCLTTTTRRIHCAENIFADWEEIAQDDMTMLCAWYNIVWHSLNKDSGIPFVRPTHHIIQSEAGITPDTIVGRIGWFGCMEWVRASTIQIGDYVLSDKQFTPTRVVGIVRLDASEVTRNIRFADACVSCATWIFNDDNSSWSPPKILSNVRSHESPDSYVHLYTDSGKYAIGYADMIIRDASDVGMDNIHSLVEETVLSI